MRLLLVICCSAVFLSTKAQMPFAGVPMHPWQTGMLNQYRIMPDSSSLSKKWSLSKYGGLSTGFIFSKAGSANFVSAPVGLQLNRRLTNNLYAFAGVALAPTYVNFNSSFANPSFNKATPVGMFSNNHQFNMAGRAELGLMYVNDQRTFSISGSIGVQRNTYPSYQYGSFKQTPTVSPLRQEAF